MDRLSYGFAAAIGYRRGGLDPNATAVFNRLRADIGTGPRLLDHIGTLALEAGLAFLGFETRTLFAWLGTWRAASSPIWPAFRNSPISPHRVRGHPHGGARR